jgi:molybdenum cofactor cytidylyltransferase
MQRQESSAQKIGVIILAAGKSARLGSPKQLLNYRGKTLLQHSIDSALASRAHKIIVVLGAKKTTIEQHLDCSKIYLIENTLWESGMASSIHFGLKKLLEVFPDADAVIFMVCDQPFVNTELLNQLMDTQLTTTKNIVACSYEQTLGTPVLFHRNLFEELHQLEGDSGAKSLLKKYEGLCETVNFDLGGIDIDTRENYFNLPK